MVLSSSPLVSKPCFFKLPLELRQMIYGYVFNYDRTHWLRNHPCGRFLGWKCSRCGTTAQRKSWISWNFSHEVELTLDLAYFCSTSGHHLRTAKKSLHYRLPSLLQLKNWRIGVEATLFFFSKHTLKFYVKWNSSMKDLASLFGGLGVLGLPDHRIIKHLVLLFTGGTSKKNRLDSYDNLIEWTLFMVRQKPERLPEIPAIQCIWKGSTYPAPWSETNRLSSSWPKLLKGLQTLAKQIREEHISKRPAGGRLRFRGLTVENRVRAWLDDLQHDDHFVHARRDLLRSWAAVAKFEAMDAGWETEHAKIQSPAGLRRWSQEEWDVYLEMPWSKPIRKSTETSSVVELD